VNDTDTLIRDRLAAAATFDVATDPRRVHEGVARRQRAIRRRRRGAGLLCTLALAGIAVGGALALDRDSQGDVTVQVTDQPEGAPDQSEVTTAPEPPRFLAAPGWEVVQERTTATASNLPLGPGTRSGDAPWDTVERLEEGDVVLWAMSIPAGETSLVDAGFPPGALPLSLDDAQPGGNFEGQPDNAYTERLDVRVNGWNIDLLIFYGGTEASAGARAAAQEQLDRLDVPARTERPLSRPPEDACGPANLQASLDLEEAAGMLQGRVRFRNSADSSCVLEGVPHIELRDATSGELIPTTTSEAAPTWQRDDTDPPAGWPEVRVQTGSEAQAVLTVRNWCGSSDEAPLLFIRLPYHVDRIRGDVPSLQVLPRCEDPQRPVALAVGPFEPPPSTG
jgi:hypothetical protein